MSKKKILLFSILIALVVFLFSVTVFAANEIVYFKVETDKGIKQEEATVGELYDVSKETDGTRVINGFMDEVHGYSISKVIEVTVPNGIKKVNITSEYPSIKTVIFDNLSAVSVKIPGLTSLESIKVRGTGHSLVFSEGCVATTSPLAEIVFETSSANIVFEAKSFENVTSLKKITFSAGTNEDSCTYTFKNNSFKNTGIERLELIDNVKFLFSDPTGTSFYDGIFSNCANLSYVYIGNTVKTIDKNMFANCPALKTVYITEAQTIKGGAFKISEGSETSHISVLVHTQKQVTVEESVFAGRKSLGVSLYVLSTTITKLNDCKFELHIGIQHNYNEVNDGSCYVYYTTDCPCGRVSNAYYRLYIGSGSKVEQTKEVKIVPYINEGGSHSYTQALTVEYANGIDKAGVVVLKCATCGTAEDEEREASPIVEFLGYSVPEFGENKSITAGIKYNYLALKRYEGVMGSTLKFGAVMASASAVGDNALIDENGNATSNKVLVIDMWANDDFETNITLSGLSDARLDTEFVMSAYVIVGKEVKYFQGDGALKKPSGISYSQIIK